MATPSDSYKRLTGSGGRVVKSTFEMGAIFEGGLSEVVRRFGIRFHQAVTTSSPVDQGTLRSGWTPTVGRPTTKVVKARGTEQQVRSAAQGRLSDNNAKAAAIARSYQVDQGISFNTNPVPWIIPINELGTSAQGNPSSKKFVERAIRATITSVESGI